MMRFPARTLLSAVRPSITLNHHSFLFPVDALTPFVMQRRGFVLRPGRSTKKGLNIHKSNRAKKGLYHGKDVRSGHSISHSHTKTKRKWYPNVIRKRVWSDTLDTWVRFNMTTTALREIDTQGGIDNYLMAMDAKTASELGNYVRKVRIIIATSLFHAGKLSPRLVKRMGFDVAPPLPLTGFQKKDVNEKTTAL